MSEKERKDVPDENLKDVTGGAKEVKKDDLHDSSTGDQDAEYPLGRPGSW